jgi:hypothetical protein
MMQATFTRLSRFLGLALPAAALFLAACGGGGSEQAAPEAPADEAAATPTPKKLDADAAAGGASEEPLVARDGKMQLLARAHPDVEFTLKPLKSAPALPGGWQSAGTVYEITARDSKGPLAALPAGVELRFKADTPATVLVYRDGGWARVDTEVQADGTLVASVDHLTPYTIARPKALQPAPAATATPTAVASKTVTGLPTLAVTPPPPGVGRSANATVSPEDAKAAIEKTVERLKGRVLKADKVASFTAVTLLPPTLQEAVERAASLEGLLYYGTYHAIDEAFTTRHAGGPVKDSFSLVVEPLTRMPASAREAQTLLADLFPGATGPTYVQQRGTGASYIFFAYESPTAYVLGVIQYQGNLYAYAGSAVGMYAGVAAMAAMAP